jgi:TPR repeat protein
MVSTLAATLLAAAVVAPAPPATVKDGVDAWQRGDYARAVSTWRLLAEQGDPDAAFNLAQAYKLGRGVPSDLAQAKLWYGKAAQAGHPQATANYGLLLFQDGDRKAAMPWIEKASAAGDPRAQYVYGTALFNGDLAPRDWPRAYALMARAASAGLPQATTSLAQMDQ